MSFRQLICSTKCWIPSGFDLMLKIPMSSKAGEGETTRLRRKIYLSVFNYIDYPYFWQKIEMKYTFILRFSIFYKFVKNKSCQNYANICKCHLV
jgi:hypothetical protein